MRNNMFQYERSLIFMSKEKVINEVVENAEFEEIENENEVDAVAEVKKEEIAVPEKESFKEKFKRCAPKVAKVIGIGALAVASFVLGAKSVKKSNYDDGDYVDTDYSFPDETFDTDNGVTTEDTTNE